MVNPLSLVRYIQSEQDRNSSLIHCTEKEIVNYMSLISSRRRVVTLNRGSELVKSRVFFFCVLVCFLFV